MALKRSSWSKKLQNLYNSYSNNKNDTINNENNIKITNNESSEMQSDEMQSDEKSEKNTINHKELKRREKELKGREIEIKNLLKVVENEENAMRQLNKYFNFTHELYIFTKWLTLYYIEETGEYSGLKVNYNTLYYLNRKIQLTKTDMIIQQILIKRILEKNKEISCGDLVIISCYICQIILYDEPIPFKIWREFGYHSTRLLNIVFKNLQLIDFNIKIDSYRKENNEFIKDYNLDCNEFYLKNIYGAFEKCIHTKHLNII